MYLSAFFITIFNKPSMSVGVIPHVASIFQPLLILVRIAQHLKVYSCFAIGKMIKQTSFLVRLTGLLAANLIFTHPKKFRRCSKTWPWFWRIFNSAAHLQHGEHDQQCAQTYNKSSILPGYCFLGVPYSARDALGLPHGSDLETCCKIEIDLAVGKIYSVDSTRPNF